jgi:hypothetical protein
MTNQAVAGLTTTYPYETISPGVARHQCDECGGWERSDKGQIHHGKRCESRPQAKVPAAQLKVPAAQLKVPAAQLNREINEAIRDQELKTLAANIRRTGLTKGRDRDTLDAVRKGFLSVDDAMNADD